MDKMTTGKFMLKLKTLHGGMLVMQLVFAGVVVYNWGQEGVNNIGAGNLIFHLGVALFVALGVGWTMVVVPRRILDVAKKKELNAKLKAYEALAIQRFSFIEGPSLVALAICFMTGDYIFLAISVGLIIYFYTLKPNVLKLIDELGLKGEERLKMEDENSELEDIL